MIKILLRKLRHALLLSAAVLLILAGTAFGLVRAVLPFATEYRVELEQWIEQALNTPVRIGAMDIDWRGWGPRILLRDVVLTDGKREDELLRLREIFVNLQLGRALFAGGLQIADVHLEGIQIILHRDREGKVSVRGLRGADPDSSSGTGEDTANVLGFLLLAGRIDLLNATIVLSDAVRGIEYIFPKASIHVQNDGVQHRVYSQIVLPEELGRSIEFYLDFVGETSNPGDWLGTSYIAGRALKIAEFMKNVPGRSVDMQSGTVDFSTWGYWGKGKLQTATAMFKGEQISLRGAGPAGDTGAVSWGISSASASASWKRRDSGWDLAISDIEVTRDGKSWARNDLRVISLQNGDGEKVISGNGRFIPVADAVDLLSALAGDAAAAAKLQTLQAASPRGMVRDWRFEYNTTLPEIRGVKYAGDLEGITYRATAGIPGVAGLSGALRGVGENMEIDIDSSDVVVDVVPLFREPIRFERIAGRTRGSFAGDGWWLASDEMVLDNVDLKSNARFDFRQRGGEPLSIDMQANFRDGRGANAVQYLPVGIMHHKLVEWLDGAIVGGTVTRGSLLLRGAAEDFPYSSGQGVFETDFHVKDTELNYFAGWPVASELDARVNFSGPSLTVHARGGEIEGAKLDTVVAHLADLKKPIIELDGTLQSPVRGFLDFATTGPLADQFRAYLGDVNGRGTGRLALRLNMPLGSEGGDLSVRGGITFDGASFESPTIGAEITAVQGTVQFTESGVFTDNLRAVALDTPLLIEAGPRAGSGGGQNTLISIRADLPVRRLLDRLAVPLDHRFVGKSAWLAELDIAPARSRLEAGKTRLRLSSNLVGTRVDFPAPLGKSAQQGVPFELSVQISGAQRFGRWQASYGDTVSAVVKVPSPPATAPNLSLRFGGGEAVAGDASGILLSGNIGELDIDGWHTTFGELMDSVADSRTAALDAELKADLQIDRLTISGLRIDGVALTVRREDDSWQIGLAGDALDARARLPLDKTSPLEVHIARLDYDALQAYQDEARQSAPAVAPDSVPLFTVSIDELIWQRHFFRNIRIAGQPQAHGMVLDPISIDSEYLTAAGSGLWKNRLEQGGHNTSLSLRLASEDIGRALKELRSDILIGEGRGYLNVELQWPDAAYRPDPKTMIGSVKMKFRNGRILDIDPGAGRIVGLLALQELPRRLRLDFKDALRGGMEFNKISGDFKIAEGRATTELVRMEGAIGLVDIIGAINFDEKTFDQHIIFLPHVGNSLPLLGVLASGVAAGITVLLTESFLNELGIDIDELGKREYNLTGTWEEPRFEEIIIEKSPAVTGRPDR